jgi:hypothetical protein
MEKAPPSPTEGQRLDIQTVVARNVRTIEAGREQRTLAFPDLRERFGGAELISTFSHLNPNLPIDEVYGNYILQQIAEQLRFSEESVLNCAYDNIQPGHDAPKGYRIQYVVVNPPALDPEQVIHLQGEFHYDPRAVVRDGQNRIKSAPEENIEAFRERYDELEAIFLRHAGRGQVSERICRIRHDFLRLVGLPVLTEEPFSRRLTAIVADVLEALAQKGFPFWEMPVPAHRDRYIEYTFLVEGVDSQKRRQPTRYEKGLFHYRYDESTERRIPQEDVFEALRSHQLIPTMPLVILATATAPQLPHLGGRVWKGYAPVHVDAQAKWLGIHETSATLILSTEGYKPLVTYRQNQDFTGFPAVYLTYGASLVRKALTEGLQLRTEFKRVVYGDNF